jgi:hypothetical protein
MNLVTLLKMPKKEEEKSHINFCFQRKKKKKEKKKKRKGEKVLNGVGGQRRTQKYLH